MQYDFIFILITKHRQLYKTNFLTLTCWCCLLFTLTKYYPICLGLYQVYIHSCQWKWLMLFCPRVGYSLSLPLISLSSRFGLVWITWILRLALAGLDLSGFDIFGIALVGFTPDGLTCLFGLLPLLTLAGFTFSGITVAEITITGIYHTLAFAFIRSTLTPTIVKTFKITRINRGESICNTETLDTENTWR